ALDLLQMCVERLARAELVLANQPRHFDGGHETNIGSGTSECLRGGRGSQYLAGFATGDLFVHLRSISFRQSRIVYNHPMRFSSMITAVDAHACGEPGRVITGGVLDVPGRTMFEKKTWIETHADHIRLRMLREPRGYPAVCCNLILPPTIPEADAGYVIMEQTEYPPMSGSNTICVVTVLIETGMVKAVEPVTRLKLETPAG